MKRGPGAAGSLRGALAYCGPLSLLVWALHDEEYPSVAFHLRQGLTLFIAEVCIYYIGAFPTVPDEPLIALWWFACALSLMGFITASRGKRWVLPLGVGKVARSIDLS